MKKLFALTFLLFAAVGIFAQERTIKQEEFETVYRNSFRAFGGNPRREMSVHQTTYDFFPPTNSLNGSAIQSQRSTLVKTVMEFLPPVGYRSTSEFTSSSLNTKIERISFTGKIYTRRDNGNWIEGNGYLPASNPQPSANFDVANRPKSVIDQIEYKYLGNEPLENQTADVYAKIETGRRINPKDNSETLQTTTTKFWISENGMLLKRESVSIYRSKISVMKASSTTTYEIDPNIKIESPLQNLP